MGAYNNIFVGPYLIVKDTTKTTEVVEYFGSDGVKKNTKFDPNTGEEFEQRSKTITTNSRFNLYSLDIEGFSEDEFFSPEYNGAPKGYQTWICDNKIYRLISKDDVFNLDFDISLIKEKKEKFISDYEKYFEKLKELNIEFSINYGIVHYAH